MVGVDPSGGSGPATEDASRPPAWWPVLVGLVLLALGAAVSYWLGLLDVGFVALTLPGLLLTLPGQTALGVGLLLAGARPRRLVGLLVLTVPLVVLASSLASQALGAVVVVATWAVAALGGRRLPGRPGEGGRAHAGGVAGGAAVAPGRERGGSCQRPDAGGEQRRPGA